MIDKIKIGIYEYSVIQIEEPLLLNNQLCKGMIDYDNLVIYIKKSMPEIKKQQTLWHEIIHGIVREWGVTLNGEEEPAIEWLATGIMQVLNDNKALI